MPIFEVNGLDWHVMVADYLFDVKNIDIWAPTFFKHNNSFIATVIVVVSYGGHAPLLLLLAPHSIGRYESIASPTGAVKLLCSSPFFSLKQRLDDDMTD